MIAANQIKGREANHKSKFVNCTVTIAEIIIQQKSTFQI